MNYKKFFIPFFLVLISIIPLLNLFHSGFPLSHDGEVHLIRLANFYQSLKEGIIIPRWAADLNYGYGQPIFSFFYPLPYYVASIIHFLGFSFMDSSKIVLASGTFFSGITMYLWLSNIFSKKAAIIGSTLYMYAPFRFVEVYVRGDLGENFSFIFIPLLLYFFLKLSQKLSASFVILGGITLALLILAHNAVSLMFLPFILFYGFYLLLHQEKKVLFLTRCILLFGLGFSLSAFFWIPGVFEGKYTLRNIVTAGEYKSRFIEFTQLLYGKWSYGGTGQFTVQLGIMQWIAFILSIFSLPVLYFKKSRDLIFVLSLIILTLFGIFIMLPASNFIWSSILLLQNFQFPWRFLVITVFTTAVLASFLINTLPKKYSTFCVVIIVLLVLFFSKDYWHAKAYYQHPDTFYTGIQNAPGDTGESSPIWSIRFMEKRPKAHMELVSGEASIKEVSRRSTVHVYEINVTEKSRVVENTLYFPGWDVFVDGRKAEIEFQDPSYRGLMTFYVDKGKHNVEVKFEETKLRLFVDLISAGTFVFIIFLCFFDIKRWFLRKT